MRLGGAARLGDAAAGVGPADLSREQSPCPLVAQPLAEEAESIAEAKVMGRR